MSYARDTLALLDRALLLVRNRFGPLVLLQLVLLALYVVGQPLGDGPLLGIVTALLGYVVVPAWQTAAQLALIDGELTQRRIDLGAAAGAGLRRVLPMSGWMLIRLLTIGLPALLSTLLIGPLVANLGAAAYGQALVALNLVWAIPALLFTTVWMVVPPLIVAERLGTLAALRRGWALVRPQFWRVAWLGLAFGCFGLIQYVFVTFVGVALSMWASSIVVSGLFGPVYAALIGLPSLVLVPLTLASQALMLHDLRATEAATSAPVPQVNRV